MSNQSPKVRILRAVRQWRVGQILEPPAMLRQWLIQNHYAELVAESSVAVSVGTLNPAAVHDQPATVAGAKSRASARARESKV